jgi:uncharacterized protein
MPEDVWVALSHLMVRMSGGASALRLEFGTGETFLHFAQAMRFLDFSRELAADNGTQVEAAITTNGTVCTTEQLQTCLDKQISLCFSIDGPAADHDCFRRFPDGGSSHRLALENWRMYREMITARGGARCTISSVVAGHTRLMEVARFWREQGVQRFRVVPADASRHLTSPTSGNLRLWRTQYLSDLENLAFAEAIRLRGRDPEAEFRGPLEILDSWRRLIHAAPYGACSAGDSMIAAGADGTLYPCQGFVGFPELGIGHVASGIHAAKLEAFRLERLRVQAACNGCWARFICDGGCCAGAPKLGIVVNKPGACEFSRAHAEIAVGSFQCLRDGAAPDGGAGK